MKQDGQSNPLHDNGGVRKATERGGVHIYKAVSALWTDQTIMQLKVESAQLEAYKREVGDTVELALREGKITPYQRG